MEYRWSHISFIFLVFLNQKHKWFPKTTSSDCFHSWDKKTMYRKFSLRLRGYATSTSAYATSTSQGYATHAPQFMPHAPQLTSPALKLTTPSISITPPAPQHRPPAPQLTSPALKNLLHCVISKVFSYIQFIYNLIKPFLLQRQKLRRQWGYSESSFYYYISIF